MAVPNGLPEPRAEDSDQRRYNITILMAARALGGILASFPIVWFLNPTAMEENLRQLRRVGVGNLGYLFASVYFFSLLVAWLNLFPMRYKERLNLKGNLRINMQFLKVLEGSG